MKRGSELLRALSGETKHYLASGVFKKHQNSWWYTRGDPGVMVVGTG